MKFCLFLFATSQGIVFDILFELWDPQIKPSWSRTGPWISVRAKNEKLLKIQKAADLHSTVMTMMIIMQLPMGVIMTITIMMHLTLNGEQVVQGNIFKMSTKY